MSGIDIEGTLSSHTYVTFGYCAGCAWTPPDQADTAEPYPDQHRAHVAAVLREQIEGAIIATTVGALQYAAGLASSLENDELAAQLYDAARDTEAQDPTDWWCCPVCEEMTCDDGCPLEPIRAAHLSDTERAGGAG